MAAGGSLTRVYGFFFCSIALLMITEIQITLATTARTKSLQELEILNRLWTEHNICGLIYQYCDNYI